MAKNEFTIILEDIAIQVVRKRVKNINLRIYPPAGQVKMSIPWRLSEARAKRFLVRRLGWIQQQQQRIQANPRPEAPALVTGSQIPYLGYDYTLLVEESTKRSVSMHESNKLLLLCKKGDDQAAREKILDGWYRQQLKDLIPGLVDKWEPIIGQSVTGWTVRKMRTKWGSCNIGKRHINLNLALIKGPPECLEMVLVHEMVHLLERYHNRRFYNFMDQFLPQWRLADEKLNKISLIPHTVD